MQNSFVKVSKCFNIFYTIFTQVLDKIENFEFPRNAQCLLSASPNILCLLYKEIMANQVYPIAKSQ